MKIRRKHSFVSALVGLLLLAGCAATQPQQDSPETVVSQRAKARWDALVAGDIDKAYQFLQPAYRDVRDLKYYRTTVNPAVAQWTGAEVVGVECKAEVCTAKVRVDAKVTSSTGRMMPVSTHYDEQWLFEKGSWWLYQRP